MATTKVPNNLIDLSGDSGAVAWASGTTAQKPGSPNAGDFRYNTDDTKFEFYNGSQWRQINTFFNPNPLATQFLVVAGGGGGGKGAYTIGGGAGAGGLRTSYVDPSGGGGPRETAPVLTSGTTYTITVGAGQASQTQGIASSFTGSDITNITTTGGGRGGGRIWGGTVSPGGDGGSGGGGPSWTPLAANTEGGDGTANEGFDGANCFFFGGNTNLPEGGGGAGAGVAATDMNGGDGLEVSITGSAVTYAGGGASGRTQDNNSGLVATGTGGAGGGGNASAGDGTPNTGGGGAGSYSSNNIQNPAGTGGSGIVILRMATSLYSGTTTGNPTVDDTTVPGTTILTYTGSGEYTQ